MRSTSLFWLTAVVVPILITSAAPAAARINVNLQVDRFDENGEMTDPFMAGIERWDPAVGSRILAYSVIDRFDMQPESVDAMTMGPDGFLYASGNSLGHMSVIRLDPYTGATTSILTTYELGWGDIGFDQHGDLFANGWDYEELPPWVGYELGDSGVIHRFDGSTGISLDKYVLPQDHVVTRFDFADDGTALYALERPMTGGPLGVAKYSYDSQPDTLERIGQFDLPQSYMDIWLGPDGLIYLSRGGGVDRYTSAGVYLDQFIDESVTDLTWIEGRLIALATGSRVVEIDQLTGNLVQILVDASSYPGPGTVEFYGMTAFSVVPEPSATCLLMGCLSAVMGRPLGRKRH